ncbi:MAG: tRNA glutamyl-Q(34) synthetase GluQRS [Gammaproteobacteria bacterium]
MANADYVGRFAPSPTGPLHAGSLLAAVASYLDAKQANGRWLLRIEDIDPPREIAGASAGFLRTLERFGFEWDGPVVFQSERLSLYRERLDDLSDHTFFCRCTRKELARDRERLNLSGDQYPGTCRDARHADGAVRFRLDHPCAFVDVIQGEQSASSGPDDFIVWRKDGLPAYQWAVSLDDVDQGVTHVVRGVDLLPTTVRQIALMEALGGSTPAFMHVPMLVHADGHKLSKQTHAPPLHKGREVAQLCAAFGALELPVSSASTPDTVAELWLWGIRHWNPKPLKNIKTMPFVEQG